MIYDKFKSIFGALAIMLMLILPIKANGFSREDISEISQSVRIYTEELQQKIQSLQTMKKITSKLEPVKGYMRADKAIEAMDRYHEQLKVEYANWQVKYQQLQAWLKQEKWDEQTNQQIQTVLAQLNRGREAILNQEKTYRQALLETWQNTQTTVSTKFRDLKSRASEYYEEPQKYQKLESAAKKLKDQALKKLDLF